MKHFKKIKDYCNAIGIASPKHNDFDTRKFQENMPTIVETMPAFRHEFYAIAMKIQGSGKVISGHHKDFPNGSIIFFNSPFQTLSWEIKPDWEGFYILFSKDFIAKSNYLQDILQHFSFLKIEKAIPFEINKADIATIDVIFKTIHKEYHSNHTDKFQIIESLVLLLLNYVKRYFKKSIHENDAQHEIRKADIKLLSRFQAFIETYFYPNHEQVSHFNIHSTSFYAEKLNIHPNHLNAVIKQITGLTAKQHIQNHIIHLAKSKLVHSDQSIKEIAYALHFNSPNNFSSFFKKKVSKTPNAYRKETKL